MDGFKNGQLLRIFIGESDTWHGQSLHSAIVELLRRRNVAGASVFRGIEGFGAHHRLHVGTVFSLKADLPILIEVVDEEEVIAALIPRLEEMVAEGAMTLERVEYRRYRSGQRSGTE